MFNPANHLGVGLYSIVEAARLLKTPPRTLRRWVNGYVDELRGGERTYAPVIATDENPVLSFGDLIELRYVRKFRDAKVELEAIRLAAAKFREEWDTPYPFATRRFANDGRSLLVDLGGEWQDALSGQHMAFFEELNAENIYTEDLTSEWRPLGTAHKVLLSPERAFGKPIEEISGAHTHVLSLAMATEQDLGKVAWWFGTTSEAVADAARFEADLAA